MKALCAPGEGSWTLMTVQQFRMGLPARGYEESAPTIQQGRAGQMTETRPQQSMFNRGQESFLRASMPASLINPSSSEDEGARVEEPKCGISLEFQRARVQVKGSMRS